MKKLLFAAVLMLLIGVSTTKAQITICNNYNQIENKISNLENQGYTVLREDFFWVNYLVAPTPPYLTASYEVQLVGPYCGPACTPVLLIERWDATVTNNNGNCHWSPVNN